MSFNDSEVINDIQNLLIHMNSMINVAGSSENTLEMLLYLAEMDPNFHKLELVKTIRKELRENLTSKVEQCVDDYLKQHQKHMRNENPLETITFKVAQDNTFLEFKNNLEFALEKGAHVLSKQAAKDSFSDLMIENELNAINTSSPAPSTETSLNSSLNQSGFLFLHPAQYVTIAESLQKKQNLDYVEESLNLLLSVTPGEPVYQENWPTMKSSLKECLQVNHDDIFQKTLRFHVRLLTSQIQIAVKEGYLNMLDAISGFWLSKKLVGRIASKKQSSIAITDDKLFHLVKILCSFMKELPMLWIRYPVNYIFEMVEGTMRILFDSKDEERMSILDILSIIDPKSTWIRSWTHSQFGRKKTFEVLKVNTMLLSHSFSYCVIYLERIHDYPIKMSKNLVQKELSEFYKFSHSLEVVMTVLKYNQGREFFPIYESFKEEHISINQFFSLLGKACYKPNQKMVIKTILRSLIMFCHLKESLCKLLCESGVVDVLIQVIQNLEEIKREKDMKIWFAHSVLSFFRSVNSTASGHEYLVTGRLLSKTTSKTQLTTAAQTPAQVILALTRTWLARRWISAQLKEMSVQLSCSLLRSPLGRHLFIGHKLFNSLVKFLQEAFNIKYNDLIATPVQITPDSRPFVLDYKHAKAFLETLITSHKGIVTLERNSVLLPVLETALPNLASRGEISCKLLNRLVCSEQGI